ncbi:hypothetical protein J7F03_36450 [Streptomyces sp. ISL-43]|uniref:hypothetical protein n=1 Tax=Streptomyces sp. ISL-43 TaxID=2819183 RepID=UPI001BE93DD7|nr:hypothetical protein [Streptomyces sp. ISL-43]MBT2452452.1 hypothetical protein [Streptomyces sp. ISL-43]
MLPAQFGGDELDDVFGGDAPVDGHDREGKICQSGSGQVVGTEYRQVRARKPR